MKTRPNEADAATVDKGNSETVTGHDATGFGGKGGRKYSVNQTKGTEGKAPVSGPGGVEDEQGHRHRY